MGSSRSRKTAADGSVSVAAPTRPTENPAAEKPASPLASAPADHDGLTKPERALMERLKSEIMELRFKARRFDEISPQLSEWRAKAQRYDRLLSRLGTAKKRIVVALPFLRRTALPISGRALQPRISHAPTASSPTSAPLGKGQVCILSRKDLRDITRVPRMAKTLIDAGYAVTVVSYRAPVQQLIDMCPETRYLPVSPRPITARILGRINYLLDKRRQKRQRRAESGRNAARGARPRPGRSPLNALYRAVELARRVLILAPCTFWFKRHDETFIAAWREAAGHDTLTALSPFLSQLQQWAMTHAFAKEAEKATRDLHFDIVQAHDNYALVAAARLAARDKAKLIYDAVELSSHRLGTNLSRFERLREWCERHEEAAIFRNSDMMITVGNGVANWYARNYAIDRPIVIRNCRYYWPYEPDPRLRADAGIGADERLIIWFGSAYPHQGVELLLAAMPLMPPNIHMAFVATALPRWAPYVNDELPRLAATLGIAERVHFLPPREPNDLVPYVSGADLGVIPRPSEHPNNYFSMPNKFLEMVMARLPIAVSRVGDMSDTIREYGIGDIFDERDPKDIAAVIEAMLEPANFERLKQNVGNAAEDMTWEAESTVYLAAVRSLMPLTKAALAGLTPIASVPA